MYLFLKKFIIQYKICHYKLTKYFQLENSICVFLLVTVSKVWKSFYFCETAAVKINPNLTLTIFPATLMSVVNSNISYK